MSRIFRKSKRIFGMLLSVLLVLESSGMQTLAAELPAEVPAEAVEMVEDVTVSSGDVSEGDISDSDVSVSDVSVGDVSIGDISSGDITFEVETEEIMENKAATAADNIASGTYYGMNWVIDANGHLTISGTYSGSWGSNDVSWKDSSAGTADKIITAKVTATGVTNTKEWFRGCTNLKSVDFSEFDTSKVTDMYWMFIDCSSLETVDLSAFKSANVDDLSYMFQRCTSLTSVNLSGIDTGKVKNMSCMFDGCSALTSINLSGFNTSSVTTMFRMFNGCSSLTELNLSNFDTSNVTTMSYMFQDCESLVTLDIGHFNTANVVEMTQMFNDCKSLTSLDLSHFVTTKLTKINNMFMGCSNLERLNLSGFDLSGVTSASGVFSLCKKLKDLYTPKNVTIDIPLEVALSDDIPVVYQSLPMNQTISLHLKEVYAHGDYSGIKWFLSSDGELYITGTYGKGFGTTLWDNYKSEIKSVVADVEGVTRADNWFKDCVNLEKADLSQMDTSNIVDMDSMFCGCSSLTEVNLSGWNTSQVKYMTRMFSGCSALQTLDLSSFSTGNVLHIDYMFDGCEALESVDISHFDTSKVIYMDRMFYNCKTLKELKFDNWNTANVITMAEMFTNCERLTSLDFSMIETDKLQATTSMLSGCIGLKEVYCLKNLTTKTPVNLSVELIDEAGNQYTAMPLEQSESILLMTPIDEGTYYGMNWFIAGNGRLVIYGTYGASASTDASWLNSEYASQITSANVTAAGVTDTSKWFLGLTNLKSVDFSGFDSSKVTTMHAMFQDCSSLTKLDLSTFNTGLVTDMGYMFYNCKGLTEIVLNKSTFTTAKVTNMNRMFYNCTALTAVDVSGFNTAAVTNMDCMFYNCAALTSLDVSNFNTANVENMGNMFNTCSALTELDVSNFDTSKVTNMSRMFFRCRNVTALDVSGFETGLVTNMDYMFEWCGKIDKLDMNKFDMINVTSATNMINGCGMLLDINTPKNLTLDVVLPAVMIDDSMTEYTALPKSLPESVAIRVPRTIASGVYCGMDWELKETGYMTISGTYGAAADGDTAWSDYKDKIVSVKITASDVTSTYAWFQNCVNLKNVDFSEFSTGKVKNMGAMFAGCSNLTTLDLSSFDMTNHSTDSGTDLLLNCTNLEQLYTPKNVKTDISLSVILADSNGMEHTTLPKNKTESVLLKKAAIVQSGTYCGMTWTINELGGLIISGTYGDAADTDTSWLDHADLIVSARVTATGVKSTHQWFKALNKLKIVDFSGFDTSQVTDMSEMFYNNHGLTELDLSSFDTSQVTSMRYMFANCIFLKELNISSFDTSKVTDMSAMFMGCFALTKLDLSHFDTSGVQNFSSMFQSSSNLTEVDISSFNTENVTDMYHMFYKCNDLLSLDLSNFDTSRVTRIDRMFNECRKLTALDMSSFDLTNVTSATDMLGSCDSLEQIKTPKNLNVDVTIPVTMADSNGGIYNALPKGADESYEINKVLVVGVYCGMDWVITKNGQLFILGTFGMSSDTDTIWKDYADYVTSAKITASGVTNTYHWFNNMTKMRTVDVSGFDTGKVTTMNEMFYNCSALEQVDVSKFDTSKVTNMYRMFYGCSKLTELDLSSFDMTTVTDATEMFAKCTSLKQIQTPVNLTLDIDLPAVYGDGNGMGYKTLPKNATESILLKKAIGAGTYCGMDWIVEEGGNLTIYGNYGVTADTDTIWKDYADYVTSAKITVSGVTNTYHWFNNMTKMRTIDLSEFDTGKVTTMNEMFYNCSALEQVDVSGFDTSKVTNMYRMFYGCSQLDVLDLSSFDMAAVTDATEMLAKCTSLTEIQTPINVNTDVLLPHSYNDADGVGYIALPKNKAESILLKKAIAAGTYYGLNWSISENGVLTITGAYGAAADTDTIWTDYAEYITSARVTATGVQSTGKWFYGLSGLKEVDLSKFDTSNVTNMSFMFYGCLSLTKLDVSTFNTAKVQSMEGMFCGCSGLTSLDLTSFNTSKVTNAGMMFNKCSGLESLDMSGFDFAKLTNAMDMLGGCAELSYINTPKNLNIDIALPKELEDKERTIYTSLPKGLEESIVLTHVIYRIAVVEDQTYTGKAIKPAVIVYKGDRVLTLGTDYTVSYKNNTKVADKNAAKAPTITVKGKKNYMGTLTQTFTIRAKELTEENTTVAPTIVAQNGKVQTFKSSVTVDGKKIKAKKDYVIEYPDKKVDAYKKPGKYNVVIKGTGNYAGQITAQLIVLAEKQISASKLKVGKIAACDYVEGSPAMPTPAVSYKGEELVLGKDYALEYKNNDRAGKATLIIRGLENVDGTYVTGSVSKTFVINGTALKKVSVSYNNTATYSGEPICPVVTLKFGETTLRPDIDYTVEYTQNINVGKGAISIKGCGGYTGTVKKTFGILADATVADKLTVTFAGGEAVAHYSQKGAKPEIFVRLGDTKLELGKDYTISYKNIKKIADLKANKMPVVIIKGKGNYKFSKEVPFAIVACPVSELDVSVADKFLGDKKGYLSAPVVKDGNKKLKAGKDYTVVGYKKADGTAFDGTGEVANDTVVTVTIQGTGNYTGATEMTYRIATKTIAKLKITAKPLAYNEGNPVIYTGEDIKDGLLVLTDKATKENLQYGKDYKIIGYKNNLKTGTATVTIVGCGEYGGMKTVKFKIVQYKLR